MNKIKIFTVFFLLLGTTIFANGELKKYNVKELYRDMKLKEKIDFSIFKNAVDGFSKIENRKKEIITIIDFTKPSTEERFFVLDLENKNILYNTHVSHGKNSGEKQTTSFSNINSSNKSSIGFFLTENTYFGKNGYSLILDGLDKGINDKAKERYIVVHGADYADPSIIPSLGRLGRSLGCPAIPKNISKEVIDVIKNGSVIYAHGNNTKNS